MGIIFSISVETGEFNWAYQVENEKRHVSTIIYDDGKLYFNIDQGHWEKNYLTCLDANTGELIFQTKENFTPQGGSHPLITNGYIICGFAQYLSFFDLNKREFVWLFEDKEKRELFYGQLHVYKDTMIVSGMNKDLYWLQSKK